MKYLNLSLSSLSAVRSRNYNCFSKARICTDGLFFPTEPHEKAIWDLGRRNYKEVGHIIIYTCYSEPFALYKNGDQAVSWFKERT